MDYLLLSTGLEELLLFSLPSSGRAVKQLEHHYSDADFSYGRLGRMAIVPRGLSRLVSDPHPGYITPGFSLDVVNMVFANSTEEPYCVLA